MTIPAWICLAMLGFRDLITMAISRIAASGTCPTLPVDAVSVLDLVRAGHKDWFARLDVERANLRRAMAWTTENGDTVLALRCNVGENPCLAPSQGAVGRGGAGLSAARSPTHG